MTNTRTVRRLVCLSWAGFVTARGSGAARGAGLVDCFFNCFAGFARAFLNPAQQFFFFAFDVFQIVIREFGPFLFQLALGDVPVAFDF